MSIPKVSIEATYEYLYNPFTGKCIDTDEGVTCDQSTLFVYHGDPATYAYISPDLVSKLKQKGMECTVDDLDLTPDEVIELLNIESCFMLEIDNGWNGVNFYCFRQPSAT